MNITHLSPSDHTAVADFWTEIFDEMGWGSDEFLLGTEDIPGYLHFPKGFLLTISEEGNIVGCGGIKPVNGSDNDTTGLVKRFYLSSHLRGKGLAKDLLEKIIEEGKQRGFTRLVLDVDHESTRAIRFYEKHGFKRYDQEPAEGWPESHIPDEFRYYELDI